MSSSSAPARPDVRWQRDSGEPESYRAAAGSGRRPHRAGRRVVRCVSDGRRRPRHEANWSLTATVTGSRTVSVPRGKVMGGSSTVNGGVFVRATADDFDTWAALGNDEWSFAAVLPFLRRLEDDRDFHGEFHGTGGPIPVTRAPRPPRCIPLSQAFVRPPARPLASLTRSTRTCRARQGAGSSAPQRRRRRARQHAHGLHRPQSPPGQPDDRERGHRTAA